MIFFHQTVSVPTHEQTERHISINKHVSVWPVSLAPVVGFCKKGPVKQRDRLISASTY